MMPTNPDTNDGQQQLITSVIAATTVPQALLAQPEAKRQELYKAVLRAVVTTKKEGVLSVKDFISFTGIEKLRVLRTMLDEGFEHGRHYVCPAGCIQMTKQKKTKPRVRGPNLDILLKQPGLMALAFHFGRTEFSDFLTDFLQRLWDTWKSMNDRWVAFRTQHLQEGGNRSDEYRARTAEYERLLGCSTDAEAKAEAAGLRLRSDKGMYRKGMFKGSKSAVAAVAAVQGVAAGDRKRTYRKGIAAELSTFGVMTDAWAKARERVMLQRAAPEIAALPDVAARKRRIVETIDANRDKIIGTGVLHFSDDPLEQARCYTLERPSKQLRLQAATEAAS